jgi:2-polyprenyl-3-methyl-5-hydroxy-6-metoxy-1,4-benzoquinol methylase
MIKHRYAHEIDPNGGSAAARLARLAQPGQKVLELGTGPGTVTRILHSKGCKVTGVEMDPETLAMCQPFCEKTLQANLEDPQWHESLQNEKFDVVLCADVLEHLRDPRPLLSLLPSFLNDQGFVLMSLPNASHLTVVASLMAGRFPYQSKGLLDNTHLRFFGREDIDALLRECGLLWQKWETVQVDPAQAELQSFWNRLEAQDQAFLRERCADGLVYQHVVKAYPTSASGQMVKLIQDLADAKLLAGAQAAQLAEQASAHDSAQAIWLNEKNELLEASVALEANHQAAITWLEEQLQNHQNSLAWTETQLQNHQSSLTWAEGQLKSHQASLAWAEGELKRQQAHLALLEGQLKESQNALVQAQSQIDFDALSLAQLKHAIALTEDAKLSAEQEVSSLKNSRSWRYTRFLRRTC